MHDDKDWASTGSIASSSSSSPPAMTIPRDSSLKSAHRRKPSFHLDSSSDEDEEPLSMKSVAKTLSKVEAAPKSSLLYVYFP